MDKDKNPPHPPLKRGEGTELVRRFMAEMNGLGWRVEWARLYGAKQDSVVIVIPSESVEVEELAAKTPGHEEG